MARSRLCGGRAENLTASPSAMAKRGRCFLINLKDLTRQCGYGPEGQNVGCCRRLYGRSIRSTRSVHDPKVADAEQQPKAGDQDDQHADDRRGPRSGETRAPDVWYYADQMGRVGPLSLEELKNALTTLPNTNDVLVWCQHLSDWKRVRDVPVLMPHMPELAVPKQAPDVVEPQAQPLAPRPVADALEVGGQAAPPCCQPSHILPRRQTDRMVQRTKKRMRCQAR